MESIKLAELQALVEQGEKLQRILKSDPGILEYMRLLNSMGDKKPNVIPEIADRYVRVGEAAEILAVSPRTIYDYCKAGLLDAYYTPNSNYKKFRLRDVQALAKRGA